MRVFVADCNHWVGFHIVNALLENDYTVHGTVDKNKHENLELFFGRNSSFSLVEEADGNHYEAAIFTGAQEARHEVLSERTIVIDSDAASTNGTTIVAPLLFGEWMPMNADGFYSNNIFITFNSEAFREEAVYISDFTNALLQWLKIPDLPEKLVVESSTNKQKGDVLLENAIYLRDNRPKEENLKQLIAHYHRYKDIYVKS
ncbi:hypothetical protein [Virgibacillus ainsalahensis]